jgi:hypothetical protein
MSEEILSLPVRPISAVTKAIMELAVKKLSSW